MKFLSLLFFAPILYHVIKYSDQYTNGIPIFYIRPDHKNFLLKNFSFYRQLPGKSKKIFEKRVAEFISSKKFVPRKMDKITSEMKLLIAASAIQLTFGFPKVRLRFFKYILVYPETFFSRVNQQEHKGEVNPRAKTIVLSWKYFVEGYIDPDGRNLGLHEMAHALRLENRIMNAEYNFLNEDILKDWEIQAERTMQEIRNGSEVFFRQYGATNNEEFFAVAIENFFERPKLFFDLHPKTYVTLCRLLRQDPLLLQEQS